jgi:hypothetical protein
MVLGWRKRLWRPMLVSRKRSQSAGPKSTPSEQLNPAGSASVRLFSSVGFAQPGPPRTATSCAHSLIQ